MYRNSGRMGDWWNDWGDLSGDISSAWNFLTNIKPSVHQAAQQIAVQTAPPGVLAQLTAGSNPLLTYGILAVGAILVADVLKRNPRGRRRYHHHRRR